VRVGVKVFLWEKGGQKILSTTPIRLENVKKEDLDKEILRTGIIAELDAINLYEQMAAMAKDKNTKRILLDIAKEEKTHVGEFLTLLQRKDPEQEAELEEGKKEIEELIGK
jgi:rubrerythrin